MRAVASLMMWAKLLYFLRLFEQTGYLVRTITTVIYEMRIFLLILFIIYFGFGEAFLRLSEHSSEEAKFIDNFGDSFIYLFVSVISGADPEPFNEAA